MEMGRNQVPASAAEQFLEDYDGRSLPWAKPVGAPGAFETNRILFGNGDNALEVAIASTTTQAGLPKAEDLRALFKKRQANRPAPVILAVTYTGSGQESLAAVIGTIGDPAPVTGLSVDRVARICAAALAEPDRHAAARTADRLLIGLKDQLSPGLVNSGLFASHELRTGVPARPDWETARRSALPLLGLHGLPLVHALGYETSPHGSTALLLTHHGHMRAVAVLLDETDVFDRPSARFGAISPIAHGLAVAAREEVPWLVVLRSTQIRLYPARPDVGVGRKGQAETYTELDLALLSEDEAAYLTLLFGPSALDPGGTAGQILAASENFAVGLGKRLRERIYDDVVRRLALAVAARTDPQTDRDLTEAYHLALLILFRLLFLAYAEDRGLLPYGRNPRYDRHAVKTLARDFAADAGIVFDMRATSLWDDMLTVWAAVDEGNSGWDVPAYNGGLFSRDPASSPSGAALTDLGLTDAEFGPVLRALLVDMGEDGTQGPVDFRSLSVREFGTIYEGLLESSLSIAQSDLTVDQKGSYLPARPGNQVTIHAGQVYIHDQSGQRKATGSYFTKQFAVEHLLDTALEPVIDSHLARVRELLAQGDDARAAEAFFDFRVADLAMGSAHFLVAAVDRIEAKFTAFLTEHQIPAVSDELTRLAQAARAALGEYASNVEIETGALLRRQVARRCIYGLDLNLMAVELARLGIWIHTFVPGLPMSALNHNLVVGNSLTGIGTVDEVLNVLEPQHRPGQDSFFAAEIRAALETARIRLMRAAQTAEATKAEVREAAKAHVKAMEDAADARALLDAAVGVRLGVIPLPAGPERAISAGNSANVQAKIAELRVAHMPYLFPEVFLRDNPGFDVLIGNPPWEKVKVEVTRWWALRFPGLRSLPQGNQDQLVRQYYDTRPDLAAEFETDVRAAEDMRNILARGPFPGLGKGDTDLYKGFAWRLFALVRTHGRVGCVFPRSLLAESGTAVWRGRVFDTGEFLDVTTLVNTGNWVFDDVHPQYTIVLVTFTRSGKPGTDVTLRGPFHSLRDFQTGLADDAVVFPAQQFRTWGTDSAFPLLPSAVSGSVFLKLHQHPRLDASTGHWRARPYAEFHSTADKKYFDMSVTAGGSGWPVYKGESFDLWEADSGVYYGRCDPAEVVPVLQHKRQRGARIARSPFSEFLPSVLGDTTTLPCLRARIALRKVTRATDSRTVRAALVPPHVTLTDGAPFLLFPRGTAQDEAYLLGILSSVLLDWNARRVVEVNMTYHVLNGFPVPRPEPDDPLRQRVVEIAGRLAAVDHRYADWADEVGVPVGSVTDDSTKQNLIAELDAVVALLYGLDRPDVEHVFATFHRGWDYRPRQAAVLSHYDRWAAAQARERTP